MTTQKESFKMTSTQTWYGYTEQEYNELVKQPNDPEWKDLIEEAAE
jgi:hypothetical protein